MEDNDFGGLARDLERARKRKEAAAATNPPNPKQRYGDLKASLGLVPSSSIIYEALALEDGAGKYGPFNWRETSVEAMTYVNAFQRHMAAWVNGEELDPKSGKPHLGHAKACLGILIDAQECGKLIDNRPPPAPVTELLERWEKPAPHPAESDAFIGFDLGAEPSHGVVFCGDTPHAHQWTCYSADVLECTECKAKRPILRKPGPTVAPRHWSENYVPGSITATRPTHDVPEMRCHHHRSTPRCTICNPKPDIADAVAREMVEDKHPCDCDRDRCRIENGRVIGARVFCCKAEAGE